MMLGRAKVGRGGKGTDRGLGAAAKTAGGIPAGGPGDHLQDMAAPNAGRTKTGHAVRIYKDCHIVLKSISRGRAPRSKG